MSAWGVGSFENDDAYDWAYDVAETDNLTYLVETLKTINRCQDYLEAPDCHRAIAAAEVIAAIKGKGDIGVPDEIKAWIKKHSFKASKTHIQIALAAIEKIKTGSELSGIWQGTEFADAWYEAISNLEARLFNP